MQKQSFFPMPAWAEGSERRQRFALRLAALYHNRTGSLGELSQALGYSRPTLHMALVGKGLNAEHCIKLEEQLGRENFPREFFRPDIFNAE